MESIIDLASAASATQIHLILFGLIVASGLCLFSEDLVIIAAGVLAHRGLVDPLSALAACLLAVLLADSILFVLGRWLGPGAFARPLLRRLLPARRVASARRLAERHGSRMILASRFLVGLRAPLYFTWGTLGISLRRFLLFDLLAAGLEVSALLLAAFYAGAGISAVSAALAGVEQVLLSLLGLLIACGLAWWLMRRLRPVPPPTALATGEVLETSP